MADGDCCVGIIIVAVVLILLQGYLWVEPMLQNDNIETDENAIIVNYNETPGSLTLTKSEISHRDIVSSNDEGYSYRDAGKTETYLVDGEISIHDNKLTVDGSQSDASSFKKELKELFKNDQYHRDDGYLVFFKEDGSTASTKQLETADYNLSKSGDSYEIEVHDELKDLHSVHAQEDIKKAQLRMNIYTSDGKHFELRLPMMYNTHEKYDYDIVD